MLVINIDHSDIIGRSNIIIAVSDIISDVFEMILDIQYRAERATRDIGILSHLAPDMYVCVRKTERKRGTNHDKTCSGGTECVCARERERGAQTMTKHVQGGQCVCVCV